MNKIKRIFPLFIIISALVDAAVLLLSFCDEINTDEKLWYYELIINGFIIFGTIFSDYLYYQLNRNIKNKTFEEYCSKIFLRGSLKTNDNDSDIAIHYLNSFYNVLLPYQTNLIKEIQCVFNFIFCFVCMLCLMTLNISFGLICFILMSLFFSIGYLISLKNITITKELINKFEELEEYILDSYLGIKEIIILKIQNTLLDRIYKKVNSVSHLFYKNLMASGSRMVFFSSMEIVVPVFFVLFMDFENYQSLNILFVSSYFLFMLQKAGSFIEIIQQNRALKSKKETIFKELDSKSKKYIGLIKCKDGTLVIEDYYSKISGLKISNIRCSLGEKIVLDAPVGTGKSVLFSDIIEHCGFEDITYIPSKIYIIDGSVAENIFFSKSPVITEDQLSVINSIGFSKEFLNKQISTETLSGGEKKRIGFLRFYFNRKKMNILDETLSEVEEDTIKTMIQLLLEIDETVIFATHNQIVKDVFPCIPLISINKEGVRK